MSRADESSSVFTDDSGARARVVQWGLRGVLAVLVIAAALVVFSLATGVPLPGPGGSLLLPGADRASTTKVEEPSRPTGPSAEPESTRDAPDAPVGPVDAAVAGQRSSLGGRSGAGTQPTAAPTKAAPTPAVPPVVPPSAPAPTPAAGPTAAPTGSPNGNSAGAPRAEPTKSKGGPPATPPGKAK